MAFDPQIILGVGRGVQQIDTPLEMEAKRMALANVRQKAQDDQQARADDAAFRQALQATGGDWDSAIQQLRTQGRNTLPIEEALTKHRNSVLDGVKKGLETEKLSSDIMGQIIPNIHSQDDWNAWLPKVAQIDPEFVQHVGPAYDEKKFATFANIGVDARKQFEASQKAIEALSKGDYLKAAATMRFTSHSPEDWDGAKQLLDHYKIPPQIVSHVEQMTPEEIQQAVQGVPKPEKDTAAKVGTFEDYVVRTYGPNPTPAQILAARKAYNQADDKAPAVGGGGEKKRGVTAGDTNKIAEYNSSLADLDILEKTIGPGATGTIAQIGASMPNVITNTFGWGADAKSRQATIDLVKQVIGKALEGGVLRKEDEIKYAKILPTIGDSEAVVRSKIAGLRAAIQQKREEHFSALEDAGYDVSKFRARQEGKAGGGVPSDVAAFLKNKKAGIYTLKDGRKFTVNKDGSVSQ